jgi:prolyl-tRNA synthetase
MAAKAPASAISPTRLEDYPEWYQQVIKASDLAESSAVRGCMVIKPWGYALWERIQAGLDQMFKATGHSNAYFPLFIPLRYLQREADHVEGFAKECAVVTHHRLEPGPDGQLVPAGELDEPYVVRPTSETIIGESYSKWVQSYRDLPILINQWANIVRWELRPRMFLRTVEILWQEGHTAHATEQEAMAETQQMLDVYTEFAEQHMAMPVIRGEKTAAERFPGAANTFSIEAMMQDRKALQAGTSHFLGQNFAKACDITFSDQAGTIQHAWTTSWGVSTRLIGGLIMTHGDDDGLVLPPRLAPQQIIILPIYKSDEQRTEVLAYCAALAARLSELRFADEPLRAQVDDRDLRGGEKNWQLIKRGVPIRVEVGPRDIAAGAVSVARRDAPPRERQSMGREEFLAQASTVLDQIQLGLLESARAFRRENTQALNSLADFRDYFSAPDSGFALAPMAEAAELAEATANLLNELSVSARCVPLQPADVDATVDPAAPCLFSGAAGARPTLFARAY